MQLTTIMIYVDSFKGAAKVVDQLFACDTDFSNHHCNVRRYSSSSKVGKIKFRNFPN